MKKIKIIGAGLAGSEAALVLARLGLEVDLYEMKPVKYSQAHHSPYPAELVCSNSFRSDRLENAVGLLKEELRILDSPLMAFAEEARTPAGGALAVDREVFGQKVLEAIKAEKRIHYHEGVCVENWNDNEYTLIATGPLTDTLLFEKIKEKLGVDSLHFFDAAAPILSAESLDETVIFRQSRYDRGEADYLNCPMTEEEYKKFYQALVEAELAEVKDFDREIVFEGCMPIEVMAKRGEDTMRFGPLKPVGLKDPRTGKMPYACVQLRQDDRIASMYNIVGFQTRLKFSEQKRVFSMIPGLEKAEFLRYGVMHRNTYLQSPGHLNQQYQSLNNPRLFFAGQMTGVEGYVESLASGHLAARMLYIQCLKDTCNQQFIEHALEQQAFLEKLSNFSSPDSTTVLGSMAAYISDEKVKKFQPMNANFGLIAPFEEKVKRHEKTAKWIQRALESIHLWKKDYESLILEYTRKS